MIRYAINVSTVLPLMTMPDENSPMASQMLFGEFGIISGEKDNWYKIQNALDNHVGWVEKEDLQLLSKEEFDNLKDKSLIRVCVPIAEVFCLTEKSIYRLAMGSIIPNFDPDTNKFEIGGKVYQIHPTFVTYLPSSNQEGIIATAMSLLNTPYMNSGKTVFGMDIMGFIQTVFSVNGYLLPATRSQLFRQGVAVDCLENALPNDLLFLSTQGSDKVHIAIYLGEGRVIHLAKKVRIDKITEGGVVNTGFEKFIYKLTNIKRYKDAK